MDKLKKKKLRKYKIVNNKMLFVAFGVLAFSSIVFSILATKLDIIGKVALAKANVYNVTINVNNAEYGTVSSTSEKVLEETTYRVSGNKLLFSDGNSIEATPTAAEEDYFYEFGGWSSESGTINEDITINATFNKRTYDFIASLTGTNVTFSEEKVTVPYKGTGSVTITPDAGYYIESMTCSNGYTTNIKTGSSETKGQKVTISNDKSLKDSTCEVKTHGISYTVSYLANGGSGTMSQTTCTYGADCVLSSNTYALSKNAFYGWGTKSDQVSSSCPSGYSNYSSTGCSKTSSYYYCSGSGSLSGSTCYYSSTCSRTVPKTCTETVKKTCTKKVSYACTKREQSCHNGPYWSSEGNYDICKVCGAEAYQHPKCEIVEVASTCTKDQDYDCSTTKSYDCSYSESYSCTQSYSASTGYSTSYAVKTVSGSSTYANGATVKNLTTTDGDNVNLYALWKPTEY